MLDLSTGARCRLCETTFSSDDRYIDLLGEVRTPTADHYTLQWGREKGFFNFLRHNPTAKAVMPAGQLGWPQLFAEIRTRAEQDVTPLWVFDAACGFGGITHELIQDSTKERLRYVGADIHHSLPDIQREIPLVRDCGWLVRWDIGQPLPVRNAFDYVICRAAIHHTPNPSETFRSLIHSLKPGGKIAISAYRKKSLAREALDDRLRAEIVPLGPHEAYERAQEFTLLGQYLQKVQGSVSVERELPLFGIAKGTYPVHTLIYNYFLKCFYNAQFGEEYSTLVNFDWYHPPYAYRYELKELETWFSENGVRIVRTAAIEAQYFILGEK
jgi:SAM-dependent methyltransferase